MKTCTRSDGRSSPDDPAVASRTMDEKDLEICEGNANRVMASTMRSGPPGTGWLSILCMKRRFFSAVGSFLTTIGGGVSSFGEGCISWRASDAEGSKTSGAIGLVLSTLRFLLPPVVGVPLFDLLPDFTGEIASI